jgi:soluble cytochrome b562
MLKALIDKDVTWRKNYQAAVRAKQREVEDLKRQVKSEYDAELKDYQLQIDELAKKKNATKGTMETRLAKLGETHAGIIAIANETVEAQNKDPICTEVPRASKLFDYLFSTIDSAAKYDYANLSKNEQAKNQLANETQSLYNEYFKLVSSYNAKNWSSFDQMYHELCSKKSQGNLGL